MLRSIYLFTILLLSHFTFGQHAGTLSGKVVNDQNQPVGYSDVRVYQKNTDTTFITGGLTNEEGIFSFELKKGEYWLTIEYLGMDTDTFNFIMPNENYDLGIQKLGRGIQALEGVEIVGQRSQLEFQIDKRVYNVGADLNNQGTTASEMLENIPSVTVDADGNVSLRGNQGVRILIDGKYSGFASSADALKQLQSDRIEKVEIITNTSARYDAEGDAGIINIILKKDNRNGFNGSANVRVGYYPDYGAGFSLNYRKNRLNLFLSYNVNYGINPSNSNTYSRLNSPDTAFTYRQIYNSERKKFRNDATLGLDYDLSARNTLSASLNIRSGVGDNFYDRVYENLNTGDELISRDTRYEYNTELEDLLEATIGHRMKLKKEGGEWKTEFKWFRDNDFERSRYSEISSLFVDSHYEKSNADVIEKYQLLQSDLVYPILNEGKFETGIRSQWRNMNNQFGFSEQSGTDWISPSRFNDVFNYDEQVHAAYLMGSNQFGKLGVQAGIRAEYTIIETIQESNSEAINKDYINFFPSLALSYKSSENQTFQLSYSKRIRRPGQWDLMPFMKFGDNRAMRVGNPDINPESTHVVEAGWMQYFSKGSLLSSIYYRRTTDKIERMSEVGSDGIIYTVPMNIASRDAGGIELNATYNPVNWLRFTSGFNFYKEVVSGTYQDEDFNTDNFSWTNRTTANVSLPAGIRMQLSSNYAAPSVHPQGKRRGIFFADLGMSKDIWNKNATIGLNVRDIFNSRRWSNETTTETLYSLTDFQWRPRSIRLVFTYRFNQSSREVEKNMQMMDQGGMEGEG